MPDRTTAPRHPAGAPLLALLLCLTAGAQAQPAPGSPGVYTCVDSRGKRLTADRPIEECLDREQHELGASGVRRVIPPSYTAKELAEMEIRRKQQAEQLARVAEEKRRERALLIRYPNQALHDRERSEALGQVDEVIAAVNKRDIALQTQRKGIDSEMEFYKKNPAQAPAWLRRQLEDNQQQQLGQKRFMEEQMQEKRRINARFDDELTKLRTLWAGGGTGPGAVIPAAVSPASGAARR